MAELKVGTNEFEQSLLAGFTDIGMTMQIEYGSSAGNHYPTNPLLVRWVEWDRFVAWVELQRKEDAFQRSKT